MFTFIAFALTFLGCINWLMIGLLQYDFVAGLFGWQSSLLSRLVYIAFGVGAVYLLLRVLVNKGSVKLFERKKEKGENSNKQGEIIETKTVTKTKKPRKFFGFFKRKKKDKNAENVAKITQNPPESATTAEILPEQLPESAKQDEPFADVVESQNKDNLFDEHLGQ